MMSSFDERMAVGRRLARIDAAKAGLPELRSVRHESGWDTPDYGALDEYVETVAHLLARGVRVAL